MAGDNTTPNTNPNVIVVGSHPTTYQADKTFKWIAILLFLGMASLTGFGYFKKLQYDSTVVKLQNQVAQRDQTIESQKNLYEKLTLQLTNLEMAVDTQTEQGKALLKEVEKDHAKLLAVQNAVLTIKDQIAKGQGEQHQEGERTRVSFAKDFPVYTVEGWTLTNPAEYELKVTQKPIKVTMGLAQDKDGEWHTYMTSSSEDVKLNIGITAVNPYIFKPKWYEKIRVNADVGLGSGILTGVGASYQLGQYQVGPKFWTTVNGEGVHGFIGANFNWAPFSKK